MQTTIKVEKTYWVGMTPDQQKSLINAIKRINDAPGMANEFLTDEAEALSALRQALLNA